jgi:SdpC family antimicrobial peptide
METKKPHSKARKSIAAFLAVALLFSSFSFAFNAINAKASGHTGEEYFNAIYFKKGDLSASIYKGELNDNLPRDMYPTLSEKADIAEIQNLIFTTITTNDPLFLANFKRGIESRDLRTIETTVNNGGKLIYDTFQTVDKGSLRENQIYQKFLANQGGESADLHACIFLYSGIVIQGPMTGWVIYFYPMMIIAMATGDMEHQTTLYKEQFVYNIYELQR